MASIYKRKRDAARKGSYWYISYSDERGRRKTKRGFTEKRATEQLALELEHQVRRHREGLVDSADEKRKSAAGTPISEHLGAFKMTLGHNTQKHVGLTYSRVKKLIQEAEFKTLADIEVEALEAVLGEMLESDEIGHRTYNHYVQAMHQFCEWLVPNRLPTNPIAGMTRLNAEIDIRHQRRALTADEFEQLIQSARQSDMSIQCFDGEQRARIYTLSYLTGLRRKEIASLTPGSFRLDDTLPTVTLEAACSKHRKKDTLPLHPELVLMLREWLQGVPREQPLFPKLEKRRTWLMVKKDLERVGIPYKTDQGIADFHAAGRHSHITELVRSGVSLVEARELARHSDVRMTMKYTHIGIEDQARAISKLPWQRKVAGEPVAEVADESLGQRPASGAKRPEGHSETLTGTEAAEKGAEKKVINPRGSGGYDTSGRSMSPSGTKSQKWRRRESNPRAIAT